MKLHHRLAALAPISLTSLLAGCLQVPATAAYDTQLSCAQIDGYRFHVRTFGDQRLPPLVVVHGGPGGDSAYLYTLSRLAEHYYVIFYDQRGTGLSPRVEREQLTLQRNLADLHGIVTHYAGDRPVRLIGHSWGGMLVIAYLAVHPQRVSHAVVVEPGMLNTAAAREFVRRFKQYQSLGDGLALLRYLVLAPFVASRDGQERHDYVMTRLMNRARPGAPYQCAGQAMPPDAFVRAGYAAFDAMLKPVLDNPDTFSEDLTRGIDAYTGRLLLLSSECSFIGYRYQQEFHLPLLPPQTEHVEARGMGHNMLTLNPQWSVAALGEFFAR